MPTAGYADINLKYFNLGFMITEHRAKSFCRFLGTLDDRQWFGIIYVKEIMANGQGLNFHGV